MGVFTGIVFFLVCGLYGVCVCPYHQSVCQCFVYGVRSFSATSLFYDLVLRVVGGNPCCMPAARFAKVRLSVFCVGVIFF